MRGGKLFNYHQNLKNRKFKSTYIHLYRAHYRGTKVKLVVDVGYLRSLPNDYWVVILVNVVIYC